LQLKCYKLSSGFHNNYDVAVLCSGDQDFLPVIRVIKDLGELVYVVAFGHSCAEEMREKEKIG
jgi:uncharacterized LabA/DUF88 family protein